jgi:hypothetical protein
LNFFRPPNQTDLSKHDAPPVIYEIAYTGIDFLAGLLFVIGSLLFFREDTTIVGVWFYLIGSIGFTVRPAIHLWRIRKTPHQAGHYDS